VFGEEPWAIGGEGFIQKIHDPHWHSLWSRRGGPPDFFGDKDGGYATQKDGGNATQGYVIAFVREPVSRLISAWKDKMACGLYLPSYLKGEGDGGYTESASLYKRKENIGFLWKLLGKDHLNPGYTVHSSQCPENLPRSPHTNTSWTGECTFEHCLSLEQFVDDLSQVHALGLQDGLNSHIKPQSRVCFKDGATPDKWDKVATGYDQDAIRELGEHLGVDLAAVVARGGGAERHSTNDALLFGQPFRVPDSMLPVLVQLTSEEHDMLHTYYAPTEAMLMGKKMNNYMDMVDMVARR
jgi:hypothetical protein